MGINGTIYFSKFTFIMVPCQVTYQYARLCIAAFLKMASCSSYREAGHSEFCLLQLKKTTIIGQKHIERWVEYLNKMYLNFYGCRIHIQCSNRISTHAHHAFNMTFSRDHIKAYSILPTLYGTA